MFVKKILLSVVFSILFSVFHLVMKHCVSCLIYYMNIRKLNYVFTKLPNG